MTPDLTPDLVIGLQHLDEPGLHMDRMCLQVLDAPPHTDENSSGFVRLSAAQLTTPDEADANRPKNQVRNGVSFLSFCGTFIFWF